MPTLKGKWCFKYNKNPSLDELFQAIEFITSDSPELFDYIKVENGIIYIGANDSSYITLYNVEMGWEQQLPNYLDFGKTPQEVSEEFYNWFTKNAVPLTVEGIWRFNKNIQFPTQYISLNSDKPFFKSNDFEGNYLDASDSGFIWYVSTMNGGVADNNVYEQNTWTNESWREIEFLTTIEISPEFALWFYENAHSMELKLYSECYIAEAADVLKSYTKATGYTIKDFAGAIDSLGSKYIEGDFEKY